MLEKTCNKCGITQPICEFNKRKKCSADGYYQICKTCQKKQREEWKSREKKVVSEKKCRICGEIKQIDQFYVDYSTLDGHRNDCIICCRKQNSNLEEKFRKRKCEKQKEYNKIHREEILEKRKKYYYENHDKMLIKMKKWYHENADERRQYRQDNIDRARELENIRRKNNPEYYREKNRRRKARIRGCTPVGEMLTITEWEEIKKASGGICHYCGLPMDMEHSHRSDSCTQDHVIPVSKGGSHTKAYWKTNTGDDKTAGKQARNNKPPAPPKTRHEGLLIKSGTPDEYWPKHCFEHICSTHSHAHLSTRGDS